MQEEKRYRKLGTEKEKLLLYDFDYVYNKYKKLSLEVGLNGELKFLKERGRIVVLGEI